MLPLRLRLLFSLSIVSWAWAGQVTIIVDDQFSDPSTGQSIQYSPLGAWTLTGCHGCTQNPSTSSALEGTWHESIFNVNGGTNSLSKSPPTATLSFYGSTISVFCILPESNDSEINFYIDSTPAGNFARSSSGSSQYLYNVQVFKQSLPLGNHTLTIQNGQVSGTGASSQMLLDYIMYSYEDDLTSETLTFASNPLATTVSSRKVPSPKTKLAIVLGSVLGAIAIVGLAMLCFLCLRGRHTPTTTPDIPVFIDEKAVMDLQRSRGRSGHAPEFDPSLLVQQARHTQSTIAPDLHDRALPTPPPQVHSTTPIADLFRTPPNTERGPKKLHQRHDIRGEAELQGKPRAARDSRSGFQPSGRFS